jgi:hypothetical protein
MFQDSHGLKATDLDAISALNSLSNSPAKFFQKRHATEMSKEERDKADGIKQSLFAAVVGGIELKESDRKKRKTRK